MEMFFEFIGNLIRFAVIGFVWLCIILFVMSFVKGNGNGDARHRRRRDERRRKESQKA